jgi:hypothetical protein
VCTDIGSAPVSDKLAALLAIAGATVRSGKEVDADLIAKSRAAGATDREIHDTVLIAAVFCMANRYVDGLATLVPEDPVSFRVISFWRRIWRSAASPPRTTTRSRFGRPYCVSSAARRSARVFLGSAFF